MSESPGDQVTHHNLEVEKGEEFPLETILDPNRANLARLPQEILDKIFGYTFPLTTRYAVYPKKHSLYSLYRMRYPSNISLYDSGFLALSQTNPSLRYSLKKFFEKDRSALTLESSISETRHRELPLIFTKNVTTIRQEVDRSFEQFMIRKPLLSAMQILLDWDRSRNWPHLQTIILSWTYYLGAEVQGDISIGPVNLQVLVDTAGSAVARQLGHHQKSYRLSPTWGDTMLNKHLVEASKNRRGVKFVHEVNVEVPSHLAWPPWDAEENHDYRCLVEPQPLSDCEWDQNRPRPVRWLPYVMPHHTY